MKSTIYTYTFFLLLFVMNDLYSQTDTSTRMIQESLNETVEHLSISFKVKKEVLAHWQQIMNDFNEEEQLIYLGKQNSPAPTHRGEPVLRHMMDGETLHFRGSGSQIDSSYVFAEWLGEDIPFSKIYYDYDEYGNKIMELHTQSQPFFRKIFSYNNTGKLISEEHQHLNWLGEWSGTVLISYGYSDPALRYDTIISANWNFDLEKWVPWQKEIFDLNNQGLPTRRSIFYHDEFTGFVLDKITRYNYNNASQLVEEIRERICFQDNTDAWKVTDKIYYLYGASGQLEEKVLARWEIDQWRETERSVFTYDNLGNLLKEQVFFARLTGDYFWTPIHHEDITYLPSENLISVKEYEKGKQTWVVSWEIDSLFDDEGKLIETIESAAFCPPLIIPLLRKNFTYDQEGKLTETVIYHWDFPDGEWKIKQRELFSYNTEGLNASWVLQNKNSGGPDEWANIYRRLFSYDSLAFLVEKKAQIWNDGAWLHEGLTTYSYDSLLRRSEEVFHYWNGEIWKVFSKNTFSYNMNGNLAEIMDWVWSFDGIWQWRQGHIRFAFGYDAQARRIWEEVAFRNYKIDEWQLKYRINTKYDALTGRPYEHRTEELKQTNYNWDWHLTYQHHWNETSTPASWATSAGMSCRYANPCWPNCTIACEGSEAVKPAIISVYDFMGRLRMQHRFIGQTQLDGQLAAGSYFILITGEGGVLFRDKLIIQ